MDPLQVGKSREDGECGCGPTDGLSALPDRVRTLEELAEKLAAAQEDIPPELAKVVEDSFWDLVSDEDGGILASDVTTERRLKACSGCEYLRRLGPVQMCGRCHCFLALKARVASAECPEGKW